MQLSEYLDQNKIKPGKFAEAIGVHRTSVVRFCDGTRRPDLATLQRIQEATAGEVKAEDFFTTPIEAKAS